MTTPESPQWTPVRSSEALGRTIKRRRQQHRLTQAALAERVRATRQAVVALESGHETRALELIFDTLGELGLELAVRPRSS